MRYKAKIKDCKLTVRVKAGFGDSIDEKALDLFGRIYVRGMLRPRVIRKNLVEYLGPVGVSLYEKLQKTFDRREFLFIVEQIAIMMENVRNNNLVMDHMVLDPHHVYMNEQTKEIQFLYVPCTGKRNHESVHSLLDFMVSAPGCSSDALDCVTQFNYYIKNHPTITVELLESFVRREDRSVVAILRSHRRGESGFIRQDPEKTDLLPENKRDTVEETSLINGGYGQDLEETSLINGGYEQDMEETGLIGMSSSDEMEETGLIGGYGGMDLEQTGLIGSQAEEEMEETGLIGPYSGGGQASSGLRSDSGGSYPYYDGLLDDTGLLNAEPEGCQLLEQTGLLNETHAPTVGGDRYDDLDGTGLLLEGETGTTAQWNGPTLLRVKTGEEIQVNKPVFRIGKERSYVDYFVADNSAVSRSHADLISRGSRYYIVDLNSKNRTFINGRPMEPNCEMPVYQGDHIRLGNEEFIFRT